MLLEDSSIQGITIFIRKELNLKSPKLKQVIVDFEKLESYAEHFKVDQVFCCLGTTIKTAGSQEAFLKVDFTYVIESARIAKSQGATAFSVVSAMGANSKSGIFYNRVKGDMEEALQKIGFSSLLIFRPSLLIGERKEVRTGEIIGAAISNLFSFVFVGGLKKYKPIQGSLVAKSMLAHAKQQKTGLQIIESDTMNS